jgi:phosphoglycerate dehydrogenase-like enzyme
MSSDAPRLLVALQASDGLDGTLSAALPDVRFAFVASSAPYAWKEVEALLVGSVDRELPGFERASTPNLRFVQRVYTGLDGFPFERFPPPIRVAGNVGGYAPFVAEGAIALALASARSVVAANAMVAEGRLRPPPRASTFRGKTALILGYGSIGREIAGRAAGLDMRVIGVNRAGRMAPGVVAMFPADRLEEALGEADVVFDARPLTRETRGSLGALQFARMKPAAIFVNVGRAGTVVEEALYQHLHDHPEFRAALDVWWDEDFGGARLAARFPWSRLPNLTASPHASGAVPEASPYGLAKALENVARFFRGEDPLYVADPKDYPGARSGADAPVGGSPSVDRAPERSA